MIDIIAKLMSWQVTGIMVLMVLMWLGTILPSALGIIITILALMMIAS